MSIPTPTTHRIAAIVLLIGSLVLLADHTARMELSEAVSLSWPTSGHAVVHTVGLRN